MTIYFYKGLTRSLEIRITLVRVLSNFWRLGQLRDRLNLCKGNIIRAIEAAKIRGFYELFKSQKSENLKGYKNLAGSLGLLINLFFFIFIFFKKIFACINISKDSSTNTTEITKKEYKQIAKSL